MKNLKTTCGMTSKKTMTAFGPSHTKLLNKDQKPCTSNERPEILADYFEHKQWAIDNTGTEKPLRLEFHRTWTNHMSKLKT